MKNPTIAWAMILVAMLTATEACAAPSTKQEYYVSLVRILAGIDSKYYGQKVAVSGYLSGSGRLYLSENYARVNDISSSIGVSLPTSDIYPRECSDRFVTLEGVLSKDSAGETYISKLALIRVPFQFVTLPCWPIDKRIKGTFIEQ